MPGETLPPGVTDRLHQKVTPGQAAEAKAQATQILASNGDLAPVDLDAMRAARWEAAGRRQVRWAGRTFDVVPELPIEVSELAMAGRMRPAIALLLIDPSEENVEAFMAGGPTLQDLEAIVTTVFGLDMGEAPAS